MKSVLYMMMKEAIQNQQDVILMRLAPIFIGIIFAHWNTFSHGTFELYCRTIFATVDHSVKAAKEILHLTRILPY
jgi:hypothetical protein